MAINRDETLLAEIDSLDVQIGYMKSKMRNCYYEAIATFSHPWKAMLALFVVCNVTYVLLDRLQLPCFTYTPQLFLVVATVSIVIFMLVSISKIVRLLIKLNYAISMRKQITELRPRAILLSVELELYLQTKTNVARHFWLRPQLASNVRDVEDDTITPSTCNIIMFNIFCEIVYIVMFTGIAVMTVSDTFCLCSLCSADASMIAPSPAGGFA